MDQRRFEAALRALAQGTTRRRGLAATLAVLLGGVGLETVAKRRATDPDPAPERGEDQVRDTKKNTGTGKSRDNTRKKNTGTGKDRDKTAGKNRGAGPGAAGPCGNGSATANRCKKNADCCTGMCRTQPGKVGRCRCLERGAACTANRNCCGDLACKQGVCSRSAPTPTPTPTPTPPPVPLVWTAQPPLGNGKGEDDNQFSYPCGMAVTAGGLALYVGDSGNHRIAVWTRATTSAAWQAQTPLGNGEGQDDNQFYYPRGVAVTADGLALYVSDSGNQRIAIWRQV
jgi:hypothetical protein